MQNYIQIPIFIITLILLMLIIRKNEMDFPKINILYFIISSVLVLFINDIAFTIILANYLLASIQDIHTKNVYDLFHYFSIITAFIKFIIVIPDLNYFLFIPLLFTLITSKTRGSADTFAMISWWIYYVALNINPEQILIGLFFAYYIQFFIQLFVCLKSKTKWKEKEPIAFMPAITCGMSILALLIFNPIF